jgi:ABC-type uncharacterized transport system involved in gliding motility auxiliary subunit
MKEKSFEAILYSTAGVVVMFVVLLAFYVVAGAAKTRVDLTQEKAYTLSPGTKRILGKLDSRVTIRYYCTQGDNAMPTVLRNYAQRVDDLLGEYKQAGKGKITVQKFDPKPDSDAEDSARLNGVEGQSTSMMGGDKIYLGLVVSMLDEKVAIPWLDPSRERLLEYDITRAIARVVNPTPPILGIMSALPVFGEAPNPMMQRMGRGGGSEPAYFVSELKKDFTVREVPLTSTKIDDDIKVLLVVHPREITETTQYALDQFVLRGGKLIAFLDPHAYYDQKHDQMAQVLGESSGQSSLDKLLKAWGLEMDMNKVVADLNYEYKTQNGAMPTVLIVDRSGIAEDDVVTAEIDNLVFPFAGAFTGKPADGLKETVLVKTSTNSELVESITASLSGENIIKDFKPSHTNYALAVRLTGKFKTAFPDGKPKPAKEENKDDAKSAADAPQLKESTGTGAVILVADSDFVNDQASVQIQEILGYRLARPINGNLNFVQSCVEQLSGDSDLISLRSRASLSRPFTRLRAMEANAGRKWEDKVKELEAKQQEAQQKINQLQAQKGNDAQQRMILSPEQQKELESYRQAAAETNKELKNVRKQLRKDTDSLEFWTKVVNIGAMPVLVAMTGIVMAVYKRKRTAAK